MLHRDLTTFNLKWTSNPKDFAVLIFGFPKDDAGMKGRVALYIAPLNRYHYMGLIINLFLDTPLAALCTRFPLAL